MSAIGKIHLLSGILLIALVTGCGPSAKEKFLEALPQIQADLNAQCPIELDQQTTLDGMVIVSDNEVQYNHTLVKYGIENIQVDRFRQLTTPKLIKNLNSNPKYAAFREHGFTMSYKYYDRDGYHAITISLTPDDYLTVAEKRNK